MTPPRKPPNRTPKASPERSADRQRSSNRRPDVVVDFELREGCFFVSVRNIGRAPARSVRVEFAPPFTGLGGEKEVTKLPLFHDLTYLAPGRRIETFVDTSVSYFLREQPTRMKVIVHYRDRQGHEYMDRFEHNLEIYRDLGYISRSPGDQALDRSTGA